MTANTTIKKWIDIDLQANWTPDLPSLRYFGGAIPVFLWDDNQDYGLLKTVLGHVDITKSVEIRHPTAITERKYLPWYNIFADHSYYPSYCLEEPDDVDFLSLKEYTMGRAMPLEGKLVYCNLQAMQELDAYYENETNFDRVKVKVHPSKYYKTPIECFTWMNNVDQLCEFDMKTNEYVLRVGIDPVPYRETEENTYAY
jgi:hypothetical protein